MQSGFFVFVVIYFCFSMRCIERERDRQALENEEK